MSRQTRDLKTIGSIPAVCSHYFLLVPAALAQVDDGTTVFSEDGKLVLKVSSACADGRCLNSGRVLRAML